jgi:hypothetical protein
MMFLKEADDLITPYLRHPNFKEFESKTPKLQELTKKIQEETAKLSPNPIMMALTTTGVKLEKMFLEFAEICRQGLE